MIPYELLLLLCLIGGIAGVVGGLVRRDFVLAILGLIVLAISLLGMR